jgi:hypothetical protein
VRLVRPVVDVAVARAAEGVAMAAEVAARAVGATAAVAAAVDVATAAVANGAADRPARSRAKLL